MLRFIVIVLCWCGCLGLIPGQPTSVFAHPSVFVKLLAEEALPLDSSSSAAKPIPGMDRDLEPVTFGIPLHLDTNVLLPEQLLLVGTNIAQFRVLRKWPNERIQWVLVDTLVSLKANQSLQNMFLTVGASVSNDNLLAQDLGNTIQIKTGSVTFLIRKKNFNLFEQVSGGGTSWLRDQHTSALVLEDTNGKMYRSDLDAQSTATIEENGPVRCMIKVQGRFMTTPNEPLLAYTLRMHFYQGKSRVRMIFSLQNASKTRIEHVTFRSLSFLLQSHLSQPNYLIALHDGETQGALSSSAASSVVSLFQGENNFPTIQEKGFDAKIWPTGITGYRLSVDGKEQKTGTREQSISLFYGQIRREGRGSITFGTRWAAGYWPQGLRITGDGTIALDLFPPGNDRPYVIRFASHITREMMIDFSPTAVSAKDTFFKFQYPVVVRPADVDWFNQTEVWRERLVSFKDEATYLQGKQWSVDSHPLATLRRRPSWGVVRHLDMSQTRRPAAYSPAFIAFTNYLRQPNSDGGAYYLRAEQMLHYLADQAVFHSDDFNVTRAQDEAPGLTDAQGKLKPFSSLSNASLLPTTPALWNANHADTPLLSSWYFLTGDQRFAETYLDHGEYLLTRAEDANTTEGLGRILLSLSDLYDFSKNPAYQTLATTLFQTHVTQQVAKKGISFGHDPERGFYIGKDQNTSSDRRILTQTQAGTLLRGAISLADVVTQDAVQAGAVRDLIEGVSRFACEQLFVAYADTVGDFGFPFAVSVDQNMGDLRKSSDWNQGLEDAYLAIVQAFLMSYDNKYLALGAQLLRLTAENPQQAPEFGDLPSRQTLQYLVENPLLFPSWRELPLRTEKLDDGRYRLTWISPFHVKTYWFKWSSLPIVSSLGYDPKTGQFKQSPAQFKPFFAANHLDQQPKIVDPGLYQSLFVRLPDSSASLHFAARFLSIDPRPAPTEPFGEASSPQENLTEPPSADAGNAPPDASHPTETPQDSPQTVPSCGCQTTPNVSSFLFLLGSLLLGWCWRRRSLHPLIFLFLSQGGERLGLQRLFP